VRNASNRPVPRRFAREAVREPHALCRVPGCAGSLRFVTDSLGRIVDICLGCERRVEYVRALEAMCGISRPPGAPCRPPARARIAGATPLKILALLKRHARAVGVARIATELGSPRGRVDAACSGLVRDGLITRERRGRYTLAPATPPPLRSA